LKIRTNTTNYWELAQMDWLNIVGTVCSILGFLVSLFVAQKVVRIESQNKINGDKNIVAGRDARVNR
jgi:hypothetical protein